MCRASAYTSSSAGLTSHLLIFNIGSGFLLGCWFHHHPLKLCICSAKDKCQSFPEPLINFIISPLGSTGLSAYHVKLAFLLQHAGEGHCGEDTSGQ